MHAPIFAAAAAITLALLGTADRAEAQRHDRRSDIVDTAVQAGTFSTLAAALDAAGLVDALKGDGPFTVFAPTDEAFAKLPSGTVESLLLPENREQLTAILTYHVIPARVSASRVSRLSSAETLAGQLVDVSVENGGIRIDNANVVTADVRASNGVIHVIDEVLIPEDMSIVGVAERAGTFQTLLAAAEAAGLAGALSEGGPFTVFAPTDEAFGRLPAGTVEGLLAEEGLETLRQILQYHVVEGRVFSNDALSSGRARTLARERVRFAFEGGQLRVNDASVVAADIDASNGVVHVIDNVLLPEDVVNALASASESDDAAAARPGERMSPGSAGAARDLIRLAISRGVPLFNAGNPEACAAVYEVASRSLLDGYALPQRARRSLERGLRDSSRTHDQADRAWALREGLDDALNQIARQMSDRH